MVKSYREALEDGADGLAYRILITNPDLYTRLTKVRDDHYLKLRESRDRQTKKALGYIPRDATPEELRIISGFTIHDTVKLPEGTPTEGNYIVQDAHGVRYGAFPLVHLAQLFVRALNNNLLGAD